MKLTKSDALFLYTVLWNYKTSLTNSLPYDDEGKLTLLINDLSDFVLSENSDDSDDSDDEEDNSDDVDGDLVYSNSDDEDDETYDDDEDQEEITSFVSPSDLAALPLVVVNSPTGNKVNLEFEDVGEEETVDVLLDNGSVIIDSIESLRITSSAIDLHDGEEWHTFGIKKLPKKWTNLLEVDTVYGVKSSAEEDE